MPEPLTDAVGLLHGRLERLAIADELDPQVETGAVDGPDDRVPFGECLQPGREVGADISGGPAGSLS